MARHHVRVDVDRIDRVGDRDAVLIAEDVENEAAVALRSVGDEDLVVSDLDAAISEVVLRNLLAQELVAFVRRIAAKGLTVAEFLDGRMHGINGSARQRLGHVADAAADEIVGGVRIAIGELLHAPADLGKEIAGLQLEVIFVQERHRQK